MLISNAIFACSAGCCGTAAGLISGFYCRTISLFSCVTLLSSSSFRFQGVEMGCGLWWRADKPNSQRLLKWQQRPKSNTFVVLGSATFPICQYWPDSRCMGGARGLGQVAGGRRWRQVQGKHTAHSPVHWMGPQSRSTIKRIWPN